MMESITFEKKYIPYLVLSILPIIIPIAPQLASIQNPDITFSLIESNNVKTNSSAIQILLQNVGNAEADKINFSITPIDNFKLNETHITDQEGVKSVLTEHNFTSYIDRLAPKSYAIIQLSSTPISKTNKDITLAYSKDTIEYSLAYKPDTTLITSITPATKWIPIGISFIALVFAAISLRIYVVARAESNRRQFLGSLNIGYSEIWSKPFRTGLTMIVVTHIILIFYSTLFNYPLNQQLYSFGNINYNSLLESNIRNAIPTLTNQIDPLVYMTASLSVFTGLLLSMIVPRIPKYQWFLKTLDRGNLLISDIPNSIISPIKIQITSKAKDLLKEKEDVLILMNDLEIVGLIAKKEIKKLDDSQKNHSVRELLYNESIDFPSLDKISNLRKNFLIQNEKYDLNNILNAMKKQRKRFAIITNSLNEPIGILDYNRMYGEDEPKSK